jgi:hypothetical protein
VLEDKEKAKKQFISWLEIDDSAKLDPLYISPKIIAVFDEARIEYEQKKRAGVPQDYSELSAQLTAVKRSLLFPGLGQLYRNQQVKGFGLLAAEALCLGVFAYCQINYDRTRDAYYAETDPERMQERYDEYNLLYRARSTSLILAAGVYLYSLADVLYFPPKTGAPQITMRFSSESERFLSLTITIPNF